MKTKINHLMLQGPSGTWEGQIGKTERDTGSTWGANSDAKEWKLAHGVGTSLATGGCPHVL